MNSFLTAMKLEYMISGEKVISLNLLRSKVKYDGYHSTLKQIEWLWKALKSFSQVSNIVSICHSMFIY